MLGVGDKYVGVRALLPPVWRTLPWRVLGAAGGLGPVLAGAGRLMPRAGGTTHGLMVLRTGALALALGLAFLLDDPARHTTAVVPTRRVVRTGLRMALVAPLAALSWTAALLLVPGEMRPPVGAVTLEVATLIALALTGAMAAVRFTDEPRPGGAVTVSLLAGTVFALLLPGRWELFSEVDASDWAAAHQRWAALLTLTLPVGAALLPEPIRRYRARAWAHR
ncbi:ABC transporter [Streptomyces sp. NPDC001795]|uniref:ABC transporter n=1 Tax=Streptomyces sp. NPDC001795 TaxID=3154525 RepID=UPI00332424F8